MKAFPFRRGRQREESSLKASVRWTAAGLVLLGVLVLFFAQPTLSRYFFEAQDVWVLALYLPALGALAFGAWPRLQHQFNWRLDRFRVVFLGAALALVLWAGTYLVFFDYPLTRDEHMVLFDMAVFREGELAARLAPEWRALSKAMVPDFGLDVPGNAAWVSAYLPGNAALRAALSLIGDPALMNPLLAAAGAVALYRIAVRIFLEDRAAQAVALLLYLSSVQMIAAAMTTYAMTAHLTLNLVWLALFLRGGRLGHGGAAAVGFVATGLHQIIFHPLFVLPFLLHLHQRGEWRTALFYVACYAFSGLFWLSYQQIALASVSAVPETGPGSGAIGFFQARVLPLLLEKDNESLFYMGANLLRFAAWQNLALIPLVLAAIPAARGGKGIGQPLLLGIALTFIAMLALLPYQGHGWGYRYVHGLLGSFALLGAYGWQRLEKERAAARAFLAGGTLLTLGIALPFLLWQAREFLRPYAQLDAATRRIDADFVLIDTERPDWVVDVVRNDPWLRNRPLRFSSRHLDNEAVEDLCRRGTIVFVGKEWTGPAGLDREPRSDGPNFATLQERLAGRPCLKG